MKKGFKTGLAKVVSLTMLSTMALGFSPKSVYAEENLNDLLNAPLSVQAKEQILNQILPMINESKLKVDDTKDQNEVVRAIVEVDGQCATQMVAKGVAPGEEDIRKVEESQQPIKENVRGLDEAKILHSYTNVMNGFSMDIKRGEIPKIESMTGVIKVIEAKKYTENMNTARKLTQAEDVWKDYSLKGEGQVVSIIDTGVDFNNKAFKAPEDKSKLKLNKASVDEIKSKGALRANKDAETYFSEKVPFGFNYADNNTEIVDKRDSKSPHGCHVAGIVAADGDENEVKENKSIKGVAPEAQLLAMKVFSNGPSGGGAFADSIIAAIDDSVALGADVINMSLGSSAGFQRNDDPEQVAIKRAADAGVMVVVSAGNSSFSTAPAPVAELNDIATVGSPAMGKDAFMISSFENTNSMINKIELRDSNGNKIINSQYAAHQVEIDNLMNKDYEIVECGVGQKSDFEGKDLKDKIALIKRGNNTFIEKIMNAQEAGALGVIVYNKDGDETIMNMATDPNITIPAIFIPNSSGIDIKDSIDKGNKVLLNGDFSSDSIENANTSDYSDFTSWGPGPGLEFKPQIAAPGGHIYSTLNNNEYGDMSGTSMAAPHASGASALLLEGLNKFAPEVKGRDKVELARNMFMNTSSVKEDKNNEGVPVSPRRQGSGLIQIEDAVKNRVTATYNGEASVALKQFDNTVTFKLDLKNFGDKEVKYTLENIGGVLSQDSKNTPKNMITDVKLSKDEASIGFDKNTVTVAPNGTESVNVTLNVGSKLSKDRFLEGYVNFKSDDKNIPSLVVPFMGFYGDWAKESVTTNSIWDKELHPFLEVLKNKGEDITTLQNLAVSVNKNKQTIIGQGKEENGRVELDPNTIAISPNEDNSCDNLMPGIYLMRNVKKVQGEILNEKGEIIRNLGEVKDYNKKIFNASSGSGKMVDVLKDLAWDGTIYNSSTGKTEIVPEGQYTYKVSMYVDYDDAKAQTIEIPVKIDLKAPEVKISSYEKVGDDEYKVYFNAKDELSGIDPNGKFPVLINGEINLEATNEVPKYDEQKKSYYKVVKGLEDNCLNEITIAAFDNAMNLGGSTTVIKLGEVDPAVIIFDDKDFEKGSKEINSKNLTVTGKVSRRIKSLEINGKEAEFGAPDVNGNVSFVSYLDLEEGVNTVNIKAIDLDGTVIIDQGTKVNCDATKPEIQIESPKIEDGKIYAYGQSKIVLKGKVSDNTFGYKFYSNGTLIKDSSFNDAVGPTVNGYEFELNYDNIKNGDKITLKAEDMFGNVNEMVLTVVK